MLQKHGSLHALIWKYFGPAALATAALLLVGTAAYATVTVCAIEPTQTVAVEAVLIVARYTVRTIGSGVVTGAADTA